PIADKVFVLVLAGTLLAEGAIHPLWAFGIVLRDLLVLAGVVYAVARRRWALGRAVRVSWLGKCTTAGQFAVLFLLVACGSAPAWLLALVTALSLAAAIDYARTFPLGLPRFRPRQEVPLWLKVCFSVFLAVLVPVYWCFYGPANFLWFSDIALLVTLATLWLESRFLASMQAVSVVILDLLWVVDFVVRLVGGVHLTGITAYMF